MNRYQLVFILIFTFHFASGQSQFRFGARIQPGLGYIKSGNLKRIFEAERNPDGNQELNVSSRLRLSFGIGGFAEYQVNDKIFIIAEPTVNFFNGRILINSTYQYIDSLGNGFQVRSASDARLYVPQFSLPVLGKFILEENKKYYVLSGFAFNINGKPRLTSSESVTYSIYQDHLLEDSETENLNQRVKLDNARTVGLNFVLGAGKDFGRYGKNIYVDIRYMFPLLKGQMFASGSVLNEQANNNSIFGSEGKAAVEEAYPQHKLNDFRMGLLTLSVAYTIYRK